MEGLLYCAKNSFRAPYVTFDDDPDATSHEPTPPTATDPLFDTVDIRHGIVGTGSIDAPQHPSRCLRRERPGSELCDFLADESQDEFVPQLKLVSLSCEFSAGTVGRAGSFSIHASRGLFDRLFQQIGAHPWMLWLLSSKYDGCHHTKSQDGYADTYFFGIFHSALIWTFRPETASTQALLISRRLPRFATFHVLLERYTPHLWTPYVPLMALTLDSMLAHDAQLDQATDDIIRVEQCTGFAWTAADTADLRFRVDELAQWSRVSARVKISVINVLRHHGNCVQALAFVRARHTQMTRCPNERYQHDYQRSMASILASITILEMRAQVFVTYATYVKDRVEAQINVIFALLTHEDSNSNRQVAEASTAVAIATKRDSSAMKTIAFMTMAFLPATFLAAFFAIPVLEWDRKTAVHTDGFQLYWIITIPATVLVFLFWTLVTQRDWLQKRMLPHRKKGNTSNEKSRQARR